MQIHTYTLKYIQELYCMPQTVQRNAPPGPGYAPGMYVSVCICKYMKYLCVWVCRYMQIHADTYRYMQIHADTYIYTQTRIHVAVRPHVTSLGPLTWDHFRSSLGPLSCDTRQSLHWGNWHGILLDCALQAGRADNVLFSELVRKLEIFGPLLWFSAHTSLQTESSWISTDPYFPLVIFHRSTIMVLATEQFKLQNIA
jgi:hypothetical protein